MSSGLFWFLVFVAVAMFLASPLAFSDRGARTSVLETGISEISDDVNNASRRRGKGNRRNRPGRQRRPGSIRPF